MILDSSEARGLRQPKVAISSHGVEAPKCDSIRAERTVESTYEAEEGRAACHKPPLTHNLRRETEPRAKCSRQTQDLHFEQNAKYRVVYPLVPQ